MCVAEVVIGEISMGKRRGVFFVVTHILCVLEFHDLGDLCVECPCGVP